MKLSIFILLSIFFKAKNPPKNKNLLISYLELFTRIVIYKANFKKVISKRKLESCSTE